MPHIHILIDGAGTMGLLHAGGAGSVEGIAYSRPPPQSCLPACWAHCSSHAWAGREGEQTWILRGQAERSSVRGLLLEFTCLFRLCRSGQNWDSFSALSFPHLQLQLTLVGLIQELAEEWFSDTLRLV